MRFTKITLMLALSVFSQFSIAGVGTSERQNLNSEIKEASISEKMLRKKLLRILQGTEVAIASNDSTAQLQAQSPSQDFEVRLVKSH